MTELVAVLAGVAVWLVVAGEPDPRRIAPVARNRGSSRLIVGWALGRPDAPPMGTRLGVTVTIAALSWIGVGGLGLAWELRLALGLAAGVSLFVAWGRMESPAGGRGRAQQRQQLPGTIDLLASALAAGVAPRVAAAEVARVVAEPSRSALLLVTAETDVGRSDADAWRTLGTARRWDQVWGRVARDLARSARDGIPVEDVLRVHAHRARQARRAALERQARAVGVSSVVPLMVCYLPAFMAVGVVPIVLGLGVQYLQ